MSIPLPRLLSQSFRNFDFTDCLINRGIIYWPSQALSESAPSVAVIGINHVTLMSPAPSERCVSFRPDISLGLLSMFISPPDGSLGAIFLISSRYQSGIYCVSIFIIYVISSRYQSGIYCATNIFIYANYFVYLACHSMLKIYVVFWQSLLDVVSLYLLCFVLYFMFMRNIKNKYLWPSLNWSGTSLVLSKTMYDCLVYC